MSADKPLKDYVVMSDSKHSGRWYDVDTYGWISGSRYVRKYFCICIYQTVTGNQ